MLYIIEGEEQVFIKKKINEIIVKQQAEIVEFDGNNKNFDLLDMINACKSNNLFSEKTVVLVKDAPFLTKKIDEKELKPLFDYVENPLYETDLIFYSLDNNHNSKLKAYKAILKNAQLFVLDSFDYKNFNTYVNQQCNLYNLKINNDAIYLLNTICKRDATLLNQNIEILSNYPEVITTQVIRKLCTASDDNNSFDMINAIVNNDISKAIAIERSMLSENDSIISIIGLLASQLRFLYQLSYYLSLGKNKNEILEITKCSEGRYNKSVESLRKLDMNKIIYLLSELSHIDILCKSDNSVSDITRFELFILNLMKENTYASN